MGCDGFRMRGWCRATGLSPQLSGGRPGHHAGVASGPIPAYVHAVRPLNLLVRRFD